VNSSFTALTTTGTISTAESAGQCALAGDAQRAMKAGRSTTSRAKTVSVENVSTATSASEKSKAGCQKGSTRQFLLRTSQRRHRRTPALKTMNKPQDPEAADTAQTTNVPAVDLPRLVSDSITLECSECGHITTTTESVVIARSCQCGRVWNPRCPECGYPFIANDETCQPDEGGRNQN
jgi:hypothetical protein